MDCRVDTTGWDLLVPHRHSHRHTRRQMVADAIRKKMEANFTKVRLKRCLKGMPRSTAWEVSWGKFIDQCVARSVTEYLARKKGSGKKNCNCVVIRKN